MENHHKWRCLPGGTSDGLTKNPGETLWSQIWCRPNLRCNAPLCLASWSSDAMQATMSPAASMDGIPPVTELYHLSVGHWLQPAGFWVQQWWAMKNPTQDTHIITSIWSLIITNYHIIPNHTVALTALKLNIESSKYYLLYLHSIYTSHTEYQRSNNYNYIVNTY